MFELPFNFQSIHLALDATLYGPRCNNVQLGNYIFVSVIVYFEPDPYHPPEHSINHQPHSFAGEHDRFA